MKIGGLLALLLILFVLLSTLSVFTSPNQSYNFVSEGAPALVVFGKLDNVYARVQLTITPFLTGDQQLTFVYPNGTQLHITGFTQINLRYPNTAYLPGGVSGGVGPCIGTGPVSFMPQGCVHIPGSNETGTSCNVSTSQPLCLTSFVVDGPTAAYATANVPWDGAHGYQYLINGNGSFGIVMEAWGASL